MLTVVPLSFQDACAAVDRLHRHHRRPQGHKFSIGLTNSAGTVVGVAIVGRPVARALDDGLTLEVTRLATDGTPNACSRLYGTARQVGMRLGYHRIITYTRADEPGTSLRAAGFTRVADLPARPGWDTPSRRRAGRGTDGVARTLWEVTFRPVPR